jgi:phospholipid-binding lipoprotein MlaA
MRRIDERPRGLRRFPIVLRGLWVGFGLAIACLQLSVAGSALAADPQDEEYDSLFDDEFDDDPVGYPDPLESTNRGTFAFNRQVDRFILDPVTKAYRWAVPKPARNAISRVFANLGSTKTLVNDFLQLEWKDAGVTTSRLVVNTTIGLVGIFDVAEKMGLEGHESDFGQTLALAGTPSGVYLVLPVLGPATVRDGVGTVVDGFFQPTYYILGPSNLLFGPTEILLYSGGSGISTRDRHYLELKALEDSSVDFYAALRSGYYQDRVGAIWGRREGHRTSEEPGLASSASENDGFDASFDGALKHYGLQDYDRKEYDSKGDGLQADELRGNDLKESDGEVNG